jgi:predicted thioredoxin/glutaredoxin
MAAERPRLVVWSRAGCGLCDELLEELGPWLAARGLDAEVRDVDEDPEAKRRFGLKVPVLTLDGEIACHGRLDAEELDRLLGGQF